MYRVRVPQKRAPTEDAAWTPAKKATQDGCCYSRLIVVSIHVRSYLMIHGAATGQGSYSSGTAEMDGD